MSLLCACVLTACLLVLSWWFKDEERKKEFSLTFVNLEFHIKLSSAQVPHKQLVVTITSKVFQSWTNYNSA